VKNDAIIESAIADEIRNFKEYGLGENLENET